MNSPKEVPDINGLDYEALRRCRALADNTRNADRWSAVEWLWLYSAYKACGWDYTPDEWSQAQVDAVLMDRIVPEFER